MQTQKVNFFAIGLDALEAALLWLIFAFGAPVVFLRNVRARQALLLARVLLPRGVMSMVVQAGIDFNLQNYGRCLSALESVIALIEESVEKVNGKFPPPVFKALSYLYSDLIRTYLAMGHVDDAAYSMIRGHQTLGVQRFQSLRSFDHKTAQIIRAGIAATKLLEQGGGIATFMLQSSKNLENKNASEKDKTPKTVAAKKLVSNKLVSTAKIIPFPKPTHLH